jgi:transposase-like protein
MRAVWNPADGDPDAWDEQEQRQPPLCAKTAAQVAAWQTASLEALDLVALFIDGVVFAEHCLVVALGIDATGQKHPLGLWDGSTENATVCQGLLSNLHSRGLRTDRSLLVILDGSKALRRAVTDTFGRAALVQRCQVHKTRNVLEYLPDRQRTWVHAILRRAYGHDDPAKARRLLADLARRLEDEFPSAAESVREGLDETLSVVGLPLSDRLRRSLATTNPIESLMSRTRHVHRNVMRWRNGKMMIRWMTAAVFEAAKGFRRLKGYKDLPALIGALRRRDEQLGLAKLTGTERVA